MAYEKVSGYANVTPTTFTSGGGIGWDWLLFSLDTAVTKKSNWLPVKSCWFFTGCNATGVTWGGVGGINTNQKAFVILALIKIT